MTSQVPDVLICGDQKLDLCYLPLEDYWKSLPKKRRPKFPPVSTANWRGYVATWEIIEGRLFLVGIEGEMFDAAGELREASIEALFPRRPHPVPATWVTAFLRCPEGRMRRYVHRGFASEYERDRVFVIEEGSVVEEWLVYNPPDPLYYLIGADGTRTYAAALTTQALTPEEDPFPGGVPIDPWRVWGDPNWGVEPEEGYQNLGWVSFV